MQIVYISNRPRLLGDTLPYVVNLMPFVDRYLIFCPAAQVAEFEAISPRLSVLADSELLPGDATAVADHQKRNYLLRCGLARHGAVDDCFLMSDDDYRPLAAIDERYYLSEGKHQPYYFYTLDAWAKMLSRTRHRTSYDIGNVNMLDLLSRRGFSTLLFSCHMPQIIDKELFGASVSEFAPYLHDYSSLTEWETYFNFAIDRFPERFHPPRPFNVLGWPARPHWPWHARPERYDFENYLPAAYRPGGLFHGLPHAFDGEHERVTAEKTRRFSELFLRREKELRLNELRRENGLGRQLERLIRPSLRRLREVAATRPWSSSNRPVPQRSRHYHVAGLFSSRTGLGDAASLLHATLAETVDRAAVTKVGVDAVLKCKPGSAGSIAGDSLVACLNPPEGARYFRSLPREYRRDRLRVGYWWWEFPGFPEGWTPYLADFDEAWVSSRWLYENWRSLLGIPVRWVPLDLRRGARPALTPPGRGPRLRMLTIFNLGSTLSRKNPAAAIAVFERVRAQARQEVSLTIKVGKIGQYPDRYAEFLKLNVKQKGIDVIVSDLNEAAFGALVDSHDVYLSMHRAEGLGLPLARAMYGGKIVAATAWSGNLDFMTEDSSILVDSLPTEIFDENRNARAKLLCAEPSVEDASAKLLALLADHDRMAAMRIRARQRIEEVSEAAIDHNRRQFG